MYCRHCGSEESQYLGIEDGEDHPEEIWECLGCGNLLEISMHNPNDAQAEEQEEEADHDL